METSPSTQHNSFGNPPVLELLYFISPRHQGLLISPISVLYTPMVITHIHRQPLHFLATTTIHNLRHTPLQPPLLGSLPFHLSLHPSTMYITTYHLLWARYQASGVLPLPIPLPPVTVTATATITTSTKTHVYYITSSTLSFPALLKAIFLRGWKKASCDGISLLVARRWFRNGCAAEGLKRVIRPPGHESEIKQLPLDRCRLGNHYRYP